MKYEDKEFLEEMGWKPLGYSDEYGLVEIITREW
jgi:hypothetical protein